MLFVIFLLSNLSVCLCCHTFNRTRMTVVTKYDERSETSVTGCIQRGAFDTTITVIYIKNQFVPRLERDAVRHMTQLTKISFNNCQMRVIQPVVFRNVPRLEYVEIVFNTVTDIPSGIFANVPQLTVLDLSNNNISTIQDAAFGNATRLKVLRCGHNLLAHWKETWFGNSTNLEVMDFQSNRIAQLPRRAFAGFPKLKEIVFDSNEIEAVHPEAFAGATSLDYLGLSRNRLASISHTIFPNKLRIRTFRIGGNYLNFLSQRCMAQLDVEELEIDGNPWKCPCMHKIYEWTAKTGAVIKINKFCASKGIPVCAYSSEDEYTCSESVDEELTRVYLEKLKTVQQNAEGRCARQD